MSAGGAGVLRVGDAERDRAAALLGEHFAEGRLDREEYDERLERAFAARTGDDLSALFVDLPGPRTSAPPDPPRRRPAPRRARFPRFLPVLVLLVPAAVLLGAGWIVGVGLGVLLLAGRGRCRPAHPGAHPWGGHHR